MLKYLVHSVIFHQNSLELLYLGVVFSGLTLAVILWFSNRPGRRANRYLGLALLFSILQTAGLPEGIMLAWGPLLFFYFLQLLQPDRRPRPHDLWHFGPLILAPFIPGWLYLVSMVSYLALSRRLVDRHHRLQQAVNMDRPLLAFRWQQYFLIVLPILAAFRWYHESVGLIFSAVVIGMGLAAILEPDTMTAAATPLSLADGTRDKGRRLKREVINGRLYQDPELTLTSLAEKLAVHPHELSRVINSNNSIFNRIGINGKNVIGSKTFH